MKGDNHLKTAAYHSRLSKGNAERGLLGLSALGLSPNANKVFGKAKTVTALTVCSANSPARDNQLTVELLN